MTATLDETLAGHDMEGGEVFCDDLYNNLKNHWRDNWGGEPCGSAGLEHAQPGMIISDSYDDRLYHVIHASGCACSEIVQTCIPVPDDVPVYFGYEFDGAIYYDELTLNEFMIEAKNHADVEGVTINLLETNQRFRVRQNSDYITMYLTATDAFFTWSDGALNLQTDEVDTNAIVDIHGNGTGYGQLRIFDEDDAEWLELACVGGYGRIATTGVTPAGLYFQQYQPQSILFWSGIAAGNPYFYLYGWNTAAGTRVYSRFQMSDVNDEFLIEAENNANHEGITISLLETNQRFRIRQNADYMAMYCTATDAYLAWSDGALNLQTEEADTNSEVHIHGAGTGYSILNIFDEDDAEWLAILCGAGVGYIHLEGATPGSLLFQHNLPQDIICWPNIAAGNPNLRLYGWNTAAGTVVYSQFRMDDTYDEFFIEAQPNANHEGITVSLLEAAQKFRVRGVGGALRFYVKADGEIGTNQTEEAGVSAGYSPGTISHKLPLYDENQVLVGYIALYDALT